MKKIYRIVKSTTNCSTNSKRNNTSTREPIINQRFPEYSQNCEKPVQGLQLIIDIENIQDAQSFTVYSVPSSPSPYPLFVRQEKEEKEEKEDNSCARNQKAERKSEPIGERKNKSKDESKDESKDDSKDKLIDKSKIDVPKDSREISQISHISQISQIFPVPSSNSHTRSIDSSDFPAFLDRPDGMSDSVYIKMARRFEMEQKKRDRKREVGGKQDEKEEESENVSSEKSLPIKQSFESNDVDNDAHSNMTPKMRIRFELQKKREMILAEKRIKNKQEEEENIK